MSADAARVDQVMESINASCKGKGGVYAEYSCKEVSWDDVQRGEVGGGLSCWGGNITDTRLWEKNGERLFTVRSDNWNEKLGKVSADQIALLLGNHEAGNSPLTTVSLEKFLVSAGQYGSYAGLSKDLNLYSETLDKGVSIRFQTTFLPVEDKEKAVLEFASEAYNYNTTDDENPKNMLLLCTTQGTAVQQDGAGAKKLYHHVVGRDGVIHRHWLEAERTSHRVGGAQKETEDEKQDALARGKATSELIGLESMGSRFNVLMTIQVPLKQKEKRAIPAFEADEPDSFCSSPEYFQLYMCPEHSAFCEEAPMKKKVGKSKHSPRSCQQRERTKPEVGKSNAARVSRGSEVDTWPGLAVREPARHEAEHLTATVVLYNTVAGGVPSVGDVIAAVDDMERLYDSCKWTGRLADDGAGFMKKELTAKEMLAIKTKTMLQPHPNCSVS